MRAEHGEGAAPARLGYQPQLDGLRALAIALVIAAHYGGAAVTGGLLKGGFLGVDLFFVLSGFLITVLLLEEWRNHGSISLRRFYARRVLRLFPALWAFLAVYVAVTTLWVGSVEQGLLTALYGFTYTMNLVATASGAAAASTARLGISHLWSLGLEEQFYLLWPAALYLLLHRRVRTKALLAAAVAATAAVVVLRETIGSGASAQDLRFDSILVGCALGVLFASRHQRRLLALVHSRLLLLAAAAVIVWLAMTSSGPRIGFLHESRTLLFSLAAGVLVCGSVSAGAAGAPAPLRLVLGLAPVVFVGRISYALYLWHQPVLVWLQRTRFETSLGSHPTAVIGLAVSLSAATLSYYVVERPFLRRKWRLSRTASHDVPLEEAVHLRAHPDVAGGEVSS